MESSASPAAPHEPPHVYTNNNGYDASVEQEIPRALATTAGAHSIPMAEDDDDDFNDIFDDDDDDADLLGPDGEPDLARNYNRQKPLHSNQQRPSANTFNSVDDQIATLSKHAAKIRLDDVKEGQTRDKDKADRATSEQVLDQRTRMILYQMINRGVVSEVHGAISTGKEANVYGAVAIQDDFSKIQRAVKVYKTAILSFKDRERYITGEHRFKAGADKGNNRKMVKLWAEKEFRNLRRIHAAGIACPEPIQLKLHVLVMGFLGDRRGWAYPRLRDAAIPADEAEQVWSNLYIQLLGIMRRLYQVCKLVHADLSEYNILYHDKQLYIIDVSQSVEHDHPRSLEFLRMDIKNTGDFFRRQGVDTLADRVIFDFIIAPEGPTEEPALKRAIEQLYRSRAESATDDNAVAQQEVDNEVFRQQYIPQTLEQVYDIEKDAERIGHGEGDKLVYRNLLADQVVLPRAEGQPSEEDQSDEGATLESDSESDEGSDDESKFEKGPPRGKRFEDKEEKKLRKQATKEAKSEKRKEKMPKHLKKRLVATTSRKKK
ncbi:RIO1 family-domain-containing protein [Xylaria bambusicola]|uniref:RIO1 family-domain-containing protein n=1 Tax=Xylaria bambusicola TaxID=326684 RepID=UPI002008EAD9|nr:RIO1 family-domain-containing protein [Xylaria bambusicola]KAI0527733.1 RIO1 family-domain-containing protein [Xylaria bambusicola]